MTSVLAIVATGCCVAACFTAMQFVVSMLMFRRAPRVPQQLSASAVEDNSGVPAVSVLIPARNEAERISKLLQSVLSSRGVQLEVCVLDDESTDGTAEIVESFVAADSRVRLLRGGRMPDGWNGKQHACWQLSQAARYGELVFLDADVELASDALLRTVVLRRNLGVSLLSGFPRQLTVSPGESLLIPLIHVILLCFLPFPLMRWSRLPGASAGCGQFFAAERAGYQQTGGHSGIRDSRHDGVMLPRLYRRAGLKTDIFDAADLATCRMYQSLSETWQGLLKNATEGFARWPALPMITVVMAAVFVFPPILMIAGAVGLLPEALTGPVAIALFSGYLPRVICCLRYDRAWLGALLHPVAVVLFLAIQWTAWVDQKRGRTVQWRQRSYETLSS